MEFDNNNVICPFCTISNSHSHQLEMLLFKTKYHIRIMQGKKKIVEFAREHDLAEQMNLLQTVVVTARQETNANHTIFYGIEILRNNKQNHAVSHCLIESKIDMRPGKQIISALETQSILSRHTLACIMYGNVFFFFLFFRFFFALFMKKYT